MTTVVTGRSRPYGPLPWWSRALARTGRSTLPPATCEAGLERDLEIEGDGAVLLADHYAPLVDHARPTLLVQSPYGRRFPWGHVLGTHIAERGYHVVLVSTRGTAGSGGTFRPFRDDVQDAQSVVAWLRRQDWFDGRLATIGPSYLGYTQLALAADPPPELRAMVLIAPAAYPILAGWTNGAFALESALVAGSLVHTSGRGLLASGRASLRLVRRIGRATRTQPLVEGYRAATGGRVDLVEDFLTHRPEDPFWTGTDLRENVTRPDAATLLVGGWWDLHLEQTLDLHARLIAAGRRTRLLVGPWTHTSMVDRAGWPVVLPEVLAFLREHVDGTEQPPTDADTAEPAVRVHVGGAGWRDLDAWPPPARSEVWGLGPEATLAPGMPAAGPPSVLHYDPHDPTPFAGGPVLSRGGGSVDQRRVEARPDVLSFTSEPLDEAVEVLGGPGARLRLRIDGAGADVVVSLCDVDVQGVSRNITDGILRVPADSPVYGEGGEVTVSLSPTGHRFAQGHRVRVNVAPAAFPRYARSTGTDEPVSTAVGLEPITIALQHEPDHPSVLVLPRELR